MKIPSEIEFSILKNTIRKKHQLDMTVNGNSRKDHNH